MIGRLHVLRLGSSCKPAYAVGQRPISPLNNTHIWAGIQLILDGKKL